MAFHIENQPRTRQVVTVIDTPIQKFGITIAELIKKREQNPRRAAALVRARKRLSEKISEAPLHSLAQLRMSKGLSQAKLAELMDVQQPYIARVERGDDDLMFSTIEKLAGALQLPIDQICSAIERARRARLEKSSQLRYSMSQPE